MSDVVPLLFLSEASTFIETQQNYAVGSPESKFLIVFTMNVKVQLKFQTINPNQTVDKTWEKACCVIIFTAATVKNTLLYT